MSSRLDRLVGLLHSGSNAAIRNTAAKQIGEIAKLHPEDVQLLLERVLVQLRSKQWETRISAANAIEEIAKNFPDWDSLKSPTIIITSETNSLIAESSKLTFDKFNLLDVLSKGDSLLASAGSDFEPEDLSHGDARQRLALQSRQIKQRMGLDFLEDSALIDESDLVNDDQKRGKKRIAKQNIATQIGVLDKSLSAREKARLKRIQKIAKRNTAVILDSSSTGSKYAGSDTSKNINAGLLRLVETRDECLKSLGPNDLVLSYEIDARNMKLNDISTEIHEKDGKLVVESSTVDFEVTGNIALSEINEFPFEPLLELLSLDLFDPNWETRHGAALAIRELISIHGGKFGRTAIVYLTWCEFEEHLANLVEKSQAQLLVSETRKTKAIKPDYLRGVAALANDVQASRWFDDMAIRLLCVFAMDRFSDFIGDHIIVPVRETCAQALGVLVGIAKEKHSIIRVVEKGLLPLCHGEKFLPPGETEDFSRMVASLKLSAALGLKYVLAVREDLVSELLCYGGLINVILEGLKDSDDDIRALAASTLVPILDSALNVFDPIDVTNIVSLLWHGLLDLDDLSSSTSSIMELLALMLSKKEVIQGLHTYPTDEFHVEELAVKYLPRLFPFLRHNIELVRKSVLRTILTILPLLFEEQTSHTWTVNLLEYLLQFMVLETKQELLELSASCVRSTIEGLKDNVPYMQTVKQQFVEIKFFRRWIDIVSTPIGRPLNPAFLPLSGEGWIDRILYHRSIVYEVQHLNISANDSATITQDFDVFSAEIILYARSETISILGEMLAYLSLGTNALTQAIMIDIFDVLKLLFPSQTGGYGQNTYLLGVFLCAWGKRIGVVAGTNFLNSTFYDKITLDPELLFVREFVKTYNSELLKILYAEDEMKFHENITITSQIYQNAMNFIDEVKRAIPESQAAPFLSECLSIEDIQTFVDTWFRSQFKTCPNSENAVILTSKHVTIMEQIEDSKLKLLALESRVVASLASAVVIFGNYISHNTTKGDHGTPKIAPLIRALTCNVKFENYIWIQKRHCRQLALLVKTLLETQFEQCRKAAFKIVKNICIYICCDPVECFSMSQDEWQKETEIIVGTSEKFASAPNTLSVARNGAQYCLESLCYYFGSKIFDVDLPLWNIISSGIFATFNSKDLHEVSVKDAIQLVRSDVANFGQQIINSLEITKVIVSYLPHDVFINFICFPGGILDFIMLFLQFPWPAIRNASCNCLATICSKFCTTNSTKYSPFPRIINNILPLLGDTTSTVNRLGSAELLFTLISRLDIQLLPYLVFFLVPVLGRMSDHHEAVRSAITRSFAIMVKLMPLEISSPTPKDLSSQLLARKEEERRFITQLLDPSKLEPFKIPVVINAQLRKYQEDGVNWLAFLNKYKLHGILCDGMALHQTGVLILDMGLGKTLQTICIVSSDHHLRQEKYLASNSEDCKPIPSLIVCPISVTGHWKHEISYYSGNLLPIIYAGPPSERSKLLHQISNYNVVVTSYDVVRNDLEFLSRIDFNYIVLDEGHIIKNSKTKITLAVKSLKSNHRLILSGTPIQNNVLELWSLFDFLMPGFLGSEKYFQERYAKPILAMKGHSTKSFSSEKRKNQQDLSKVHEAGTLALESLHKQVLPFLLRRLKEDVLHDLPPKIIQDYYCEMNSLQQILYDDYQKEQQSKIISQIDDSTPEQYKAFSGHIFQALQYLRKLCNHPCMAVDPSHASWDKVQSILENDRANLTNFRYSPKLVALKELLTSCGIGTDDTEQEFVVSPHRALIFCQMKSMADLVIEMLKQEMPSVTYMKMDGSTDPSKRQDLVFQFNSDPSIDCMILTTSVGGLGLNLTGADTVIFVEHDWNPMKDLQAMDRAHRLGQKKVVNVYRLITKDTLEEKIMGLQKFKLNIANTIINQENSGSGLKSMAADEILELFDVKDRKGSKREAEDPGSSRKKQKLDSVTGVTGLSQSLIEELDKLTDSSQEQYEEAFDFGKFMNKIQK